MQTVGTNAHVILEQYTGDSILKEHPHTNGINVHNTNGSLLSQSGESCMKSDSVTTSDSIEELSTTRGRIFVLSASDKISLKSYIERLGKSTLTRWTEHAYTLLYLWTDQPSIVCLQVHVS